LLKNLLEARVIQANQNKTTIGKRLKHFVSVAYPGMLFGGGSTNSVEDRENGDLGTVAP